MTVIFTAYFLRQQPIYLSKNALIRDKFKSIHKTKIYRYTARIFCGIDKMKRIEVFKSISRVNMIINSSSIHV